MAGKTLTAKVRFETSTAERSLKRLESKIRAVNKAVNTTSSSNNKLTTAINKANTATTKLNRTTQRVATTTAKVTNTAKKINTANKQATSSAKQLASAYQTGNSHANGLLRTVKRLAATYLGVMGTKAAIQTSDTITSTQNKLNTINGGDVNLTQNQMDKMYTSANKVRMAYTDMLANASKSMTLAPDAFQGSMDNAIRFQEIMAETYTLGGASAAEMSTSMYQMIQALGAGTLAGDELRSVREGAPLAYREIEKFAQRVLNSKESLKDLASQGLITSEMVVAAVMNAGEAIDSQFENTYWTFDQAWNRIKNSAVKAFEPVSNSLRDMLNRAIENGAFEKIEQAFVNISKVIQIVFAVIERGVQWIANNWSWLKEVIIGALILIGSYYLVTGAIAIATAVQMAIAWAMANWPLLLIVASLALIIYAFYQVTQGALTMCEFIVICALVIATAFLIAGIIIGSIPMIIIALVIALLAVIFLFFEEVCYGTAWLAAWIVNIVFGIVNVVITIVLAIATIIQWVIAFIVNLVMGLEMSLRAILYNVLAAIVNVSMGIWNVISAVCQNIGIAFANAWNGAMSSFWNFIADCIDGLNWLMKPLSAIAELFGKSFDAKSFSAGIRGKAGGYTQQDYVSLSDAWSSGMNTMSYKSVGGAWSDGWNTMNFASFGSAIDSGMGTLSYVDANAWGSSAGNWGAGITDSINNWGSQFQTGGSSKLSLDSIGEKLGLSFNDALSDPTGDISKSYDMPEDLLDNVGKTADNTGSMADSMELAQEDLEYLRKIAEMEWKKEYTTANITVDMTNYNTVEGDGDLDGIVTKLSDKLLEEMRTLPNGVYV